MENLQKGQRFIFSGSPNASKNGTWEVISVSYMKSGKADYYRCVRVTKHGALSMPGIKDGAYTTRNRREFGVYQMNHLHSGETITVLCQCGSGQPVKYKCHECESELCSDCAIDRSKDYYPSDSLWCKCGNPVDEI